MREYLLVFVVAAVMTYVATPFVRWLALATGAITAVRDRDIHTVPFARLGGVAMLLGFVAALLVASRLPYLSQIFRGGEMMGVLIGAVIMCAVGVLAKHWRAAPAMVNAANARRRRGSPLPPPIFRITIILPNLPVRYSDFSPGSSSTSS